MARKSGYLDSSKSHYCQNYRSTDAFKQVSRVMRTVFTVRTCVNCCFVGFVQMTLDLSCTRVDCHGNRIFSPEIGSGLPLAEDDVWFEVMYGFFYGSTASVCISFKPRLKSLLKMIFRCVMWTISLRKHRTFFLMWHGGNGMFLVSLHEWDCIWHLSHYCFDVNAWALNINSWSSS